MTPQRTLIGTVEILVPREYALNHNDDVMTASITAAVGPGTYPLFEQDDLIFWEMTGEIQYQQSEATFEKIADMEGAFIVHPPLTTKTGTLVTFPSRTFTRTDWDDFVANDPLTQPGTPSHRLNTTVHEGDDRVDPRPGWGW